MKKTIIVISYCAIFLIISALLINIITSLVPRFSTYEEQKKYGSKMYDVAGKIDEAAFYTTSPFRCKLIKWVLLLPAWNKSVNANLYTLKKFPQAKEDVDVLGWIADSYFYGKKYDKARGWYEKQLEVFKRKYFKNSLYPERKNATDKKALTEELRYIVSIQNSIASCYTAIGEFNLGIEAYEGSLKLLEDVANIEDRDKEAIFKEVYINTARVYKIALKDYQKAIETYKRMENVFPEPFYICEAEIYIGDTYLAMGNIEKAKGVYRAVLDKYKYSGSLTNYIEAEKRLKSLNEGTSFVALDRVIYKIKDGKVIVKYF